MSARDPAVSHPTSHLPVLDASQVAEARRAVAVLARACGFDDTAIGRAEIIATEMATNLIRHGGGGAVLAGRVDHIGAPGGAGDVGLELIAVDQGRGMADPAQCLRDGYSTAGSSGTGLGAIRRQSDGFDLYSRPGQGTVVAARLWMRPSAPAAPSGIAAAEGRGFAIAAISMAQTGENECGDGWMASGTWPALRVGVVDGLGHGPRAAEAARAALLAVAARPDDQPDAVLRHVHDAIRHTRGAAAAIVDLDAAQRGARFAGVGNISAVIAGEAAPRNLVSHNGTLGHQALRFQSFAYPYPPGGLVVLHSDGVSARWDLARYPGLAARHPAVVAAVLWRDFQRGRDDATVVVARER